MASLILNRGAALAYRAVPSFLSCSADTSLCVSIRKTDCLLQRLRDRVHQPCCIDDRSFFDISIPILNRRVGKRIVDCVEYVFVAFGVEKNRIVDAAVMLRTLL